MKRILFIFVLLMTAAVLAQTPAKKSTPANPATGATAAKTPAASTDSSLPSRQTVEDFLHHTFGYEQNLKWQVAEIKHAADPSLSEVSVALNTPEGPRMLKFFVTPNQKWVISPAIGELVPFGSDPYAAARHELQKAAGPSRGPANPSVVIVEFGDLQCPACKRAQPTIEKLMADEPNAKLIFQQFPLTQIHKWAMVAAKYGLCVAKQNNDAYWKFIDAVYAHQDEMQQVAESQVSSQVVPKLKQYAGEAGVNADQAESCTADPTIAAQIDASMKLGQQLDITGTPTLFIGGRKIGNVGGIPYDTLKGITEFQAQSH